MRCKTSMLYITIQESNLLYRSRLDRDLDKAVLDYVSSISDDGEIIMYDILGSQAHTVMLYETGLIGRRDAGRILSALQGLEKARPGQDGKHEDIHELIESLVIGKAGPASGGRMHTGRSRNDQVALDMRMKIRHDTAAIFGQTAGLVRSMLELASRHTGTVMPLYTHMQQAQAGTFSHYMLAHAGALTRDAGRLCDSFPRVNQSPLGAGAVGGTSLPIDRGMTAQLLGFEGLVENSIDATSSRDFAAEYASVAAILMTNLSRLAEDFVIWSTSEFSFIELPDSLSSPSSVMPQKKNPDIMELTRGKAARAIGNLTGVLAASKGLATGYGRDLQEIKPLLWGSGRMASGALAVAESAVRSVTVNKAAMRKAASRGYLAALDVAEGLVIEGVPFRKAHKITGKLVQSAAAAGKPLDRLPPAEIKKALRGSGVDAAAVARLVRSATVQESLKRRVSRGSPAAAEQSRMIKEAGAAIDALSRRMDIQYGRVSSRLRTLSKKAAELAG
ncbi:argininosuccinate lyase [Cenarchaeum symbiosum A]|uniref:Argininosuccinate lyase n=1 Tax=Cenarchaeum symbiosum (strain A) TaxID=414004 RepID=A0RY97_CENSY|nr:argininosuccinate lyase [Cenarchaeum symbiosum A]